MIDLALGLVAAGIVVLSLESVRVALVLFGVLDTGSLGTAESSMAKVAVSEALMRVADRCVQVMGGTGVSSETIVEQAFREIRAFRIYDGPTEVHKWSLAKKIKRDSTNFERTRLTMKPVTTADTENSRSRG